MYALIPSGMATLFDTRLLKEISVPGASGVLALHKSWVLFAIADSRYAERKDAQMRVAAAMDRVVILFLGLLIVLIVSN